MNSKEYEAITLRLNEMHAALAATTLALCAATSLLTKAQQKELLARFARDSAEKQAFVEQSQQPGSEAVLQLLQAAEQRMYLTLQQTWAAHEPG